MAKFYGPVGFVKTEETKPGVWEEAVTEHKYFGDVTKNTRRLENGENIHDKIVVNNIISIVADPSALQNFFAIRYVEWMGCRWEVTNVEMLSPRLVLTLGGVYNGSET